MSFMKILFSYAFRPFFLLIGGYAVVMIAAWGLHQAGVPVGSGALPAKVRHGHEMLFGFAGGAIAGFLLTAVATWTQRPPVAGLPLIALCGFWSAARVGALLPDGFGWGLWASASLLFWAWLLVLMAREVVGAKNLRNYKALVLLLAFLGAEAVFFLSGPDNFHLMEGSLYAGIFLILGMISLIGGRIIPAFTQNWLRLTQPGRTVQLPAFDRIDLIAVGLMTAFATGLILWPAAMVTGWLGLLAAAAQAARLVRWQGWLTRREPLLWVLHLGYAWIPTGFGLLGLTALGHPGLFDAGLHALTYGAIGTMILGVAARVALGHTGRPLLATPAMTIAFWLITLGALARLFAPAGSGLMVASVLLWVSAYGIFLARYAPILLAPRLDAR